MPRPRHRSYIPLDYKRAFVGFAAVVMPIRADEAGVRATIDGDACSITTRTVC